jgi:hypothetical protein
VSDILIGSLLTLVLTGLAQFGKAFFDSKKNKMDATLSASDQALLIYKNLVATLQDNFDKLNIETNNLEKEFLACRELNVELKVNKVYLEEKIRELQEEIKRLKSC